MNDPQDKLDSKNVSWREVFMIINLKIKAINNNHKSRFLVGLVVFAVLLNFSSLFLFSPIFYKDNTSYTVPSDIVKANYFTQFEDNSSTLHALAVHDESPTNWMDYLILKKNYGNLLPYLVREEDSVLRLDLSGENKPSEGKVIDTTNVNEMVTAAYVAASSEARLNNNYKTDYTIISTPYSEDGSNFNVKVEPGDEILTINGESIKSSSQLYYLTAANDIKDIKVLRFGKERDVESTLYGAYIKVTNNVEDKKALQRSVKLFDNRYVGNSAGAAIALELYNKFHGDVIKGRNIAITGAIDEEGRISPVGGVPGKTVLAQRNGISIMFVPYDNDLASNYSDANKVNKAIKDSKMEIVPVETLHEIVEYLSN